MAHTRGGNNRALDPAGRGSSILTGRLLFLQTVQLRYADIFDELRGPDDDTVWRERHHLADSWIQLDPYSAVRRFFLAGVVPLPILDDLSDEMPRFPQPEPDLDRWPDYLERVRDVAEMLWEEATGRAIADGAEPAIRFRGSHAEWTADFQVGKKTWAQIADSMSSSSAGQDERVIRRAVTEFADRIGLTLRTK